MSIEFINEADYHVDGLDPKEFIDLARFVLESLHVHRQAELCILLVDSTTMADLHAKWMDLEGPTDVMSFPMDGLRPGTSEQESSPGMLGDVVVCPEVAAAQAQSAGHSTVEEMLLLVTHGILHLLGFDHSEPDEEREMFALQRRLLLTFLAGR